MGRAFTTWICASIMALAATPCEGADDADLQSSSIMTFEEISCPFEKGLTLDNALKSALKNKPDATEQAVLERAVKNLYYQIQATQTKLKYQHSFSDALQLAKDVAMSQYEAGNIGAFRTTEQGVLLEKSLLDMGETQGELVLLRDEFNTILGLSGAAAQWCMSSDLPAVDFEEVPLKEIVANPDVMLEDAYTLMFIRHEIILYYQEVIIPTTNQRLELVEEAYNSKALGLYELLYAKLEQLTTQIDYTMALKDYWLARVAVEQSYTKPFPSKPMSAPQNIREPIAPLTVTPTPIPSSAPASSDLSYTPVEAPNGSTLLWTMVDGVKVFHLKAEPIIREFAPGLVIKCWGYNGQTPGPVIEAVEGDRVRILITNRLAIPTSLQWHGLIIPNGMDGVPGLTQRPVMPGETFQYEFTLQKSGTFMYHPYIDDVTHVGMGLVGFFIVHPKIAEQPKMDRDFAIFLDEWAVPTGSYAPDPYIVADFNLYTFNGKVAPATAPLVAKKGDRVRLRLANMSMDCYSIYLHGHTLRVISHGVGKLPYESQVDEISVEVPCGAAREVEFSADYLGDWPLQSCNGHQVVNNMTHELPNLIGVDQSTINAQLRAIIPDSKQGLPNIPTSTMEGPIGPIKCGGMFTLLKVREGITSYTDPGWYKQPSMSGAQPTTTNP